MIRPEQTTRDRIRTLLSDGVARTASMLAAELGLKQNTAYKVLQRMIRAGQAVRGEDGYIRLPGQAGEDFSRPPEVQSARRHDAVAMRLAAQSSGSGQALVGFAVRSAVSESQLRPPQRAALDLRSPSADQDRGQGRPVSMTDAAAAQLAAPSAGPIFPSYFGYAGVVEPEYDLLEPYTMLDTEVYFRQAIQRRLSLMFRNGIRIMSDSQSIDAYIRRRIGRMEIFMQQDFSSFLKDILFNLMICSNCILVKVRSSASSDEAGPNEKNGFRTPVAGYRILPPYRIFPVLDGRGRIEKWRSYLGAGRIAEEFPAEDVLHFFWDRKPGHIFGTPRTIAVRDDIVALRRIEEHMELLMNRMLFPMFHFKVGTEKAPCQITADGISEIDLVRRIIESMPRDGMLITDERVSGEVLESGLKGIDITPILNHYKRRVITGLGISSLDLGEPDTSNRATADNISQNLKDVVASDCAWFAGQVKQMIFRDWIEESPVNWNVQRALSRINLEFPEIDVDSMIKLETHAINAYNNNALTLAELRSRMKLPPLSDEALRQTHFHQHTLPLASMRSLPSRNPAESQTQTLVQPENQHGKNQGPSRAKSSLVRELLADLRDTVELIGGEDACQAAEMWALSWGADPESARSLAAEIAPVWSDEAAAGRILSGWVERKIASGVKEDSVG